MTAAPPTFQPGDALLVVDPQRDFCPGGSLGVRDGDAVMPVINAWTAAAARAGIAILVSRDWHPPRTTHFAAYGGIWPPHCVSGTDGAAFHPDLHLPASAITVSKGTGEHDDAYSAFDAHTADGTPLGHLLAHRGVRHLYVMGLATDYCVKASTLDARAAGLAVSVVRDAIRAVDLRPDDGEQALAAMRAAGAELL
jgi:nicotinamidase/pyrazinamidase